VKHLKFFESFEGIDLSYYCEEYWDVDPEYLFEIVQHEVEDNSLKKMRFIFEKADKHNITLIVSERDKLSASGFSGRVSDISEYYWKKFFDEIKRVEKEKWYPEFPKLGKEMWESSIYKTSVYFEDKSYMGGMKPNIYFPEIQLGFDNSSIIEDGNIGDWEDTFNSLFEKVGIPYAFDGDNGYLEGSIGNPGNIIWYTLYHT
jgi:hypothetical protein